MVDVAIIGAGAAGITAARRLVAAQREVLLLEAGACVGGRARTVMAQGMALDLGCEWLHSADRNDWVSIAEQSGFTIDRTPPFWDRQSGGKDFTAAEQIEFRRAMGAFFERIHHAGVDGRDVPASSYFESDSRWNPLIDAVGGYYNGAVWEEVSTHDFNAYVDTGLNWRVREGYGALIAHYARDVPVTLDCPVSVVDWRGAGVRLETAQGVIEADKVIIAAPSSVIAGGLLRFDPDLPDKAEAADNLPLGAVEKVYLHLAEPEMFAADGHLFGRIDTADTASYQLRPFGWPVIEVFIADEIARRLDREHDAALADFAIGELVGLFGSSVRTKLAPIARSHWLGSPYIGGAYSHARVGCAGARATLRAPIAQKLYFAGEACSAEFYSTAHGAFESGVAAADALLAGA